MTLENHFNSTFTAKLALREKQIQQSYRPVIGVHKWFARRPGTVFRSLLLAEFNSSEPIDVSFWRAHQFRGLIADPFMGGGTPVFEAIRMGFSVVGTDINPMAYWIVRQSLQPHDLDTFLTTAESVSKDVEKEVGDYYQTDCIKCHRTVPVKYFLWVKTERCTCCGTENDLFPGYVLAEPLRHPSYVVVCSTCGALNEFQHKPTRSKPEPCSVCGHLVHSEGPARRRRTTCTTCRNAYSYPQKNPTHPPNHRLWAIEYHCEACKPLHRGRFFKRPDSEDHERFELSTTEFGENPDLPIPEEAIPNGDETDRLHRWGYRYFREMFNERQLLGLGLLLRRIRAVKSPAMRHALLTVFSDFLRYQNMLCRYDTKALKCQDIFSVHGFPVGLVQCENNLLGIPGVGSGSFRHFVQKYLRAKRYCEAPFENHSHGRSRRRVTISGERIEAQFIGEIPTSKNRQARLLAAPATAMPLPPESLDGVFTDPPYFDNVQYAELIDFCFVWLRLGLRDEFPEFRPNSTRSNEELTGNVTLGRDLEYFTRGLSTVFRHYAAALKPGAPFVFTYHHNEPIAYVPLIVAILDAGMDCTATLPVPAEMSASLHIAGTNSSILDSVFVCRRETSQHSHDDLWADLVNDSKALMAAGLSITEGDLRCLAAGHLARFAVNALYSTWDSDASVVERMASARRTLAGFRYDLQKMLPLVLAVAKNSSLQKRLPFLV